MTSDTFKESVRSDVSSNTPKGVYRKEYFLRFVIDLSVLDVMSWPFFCIPLGVLDV